MEVARNELPPKSITPVVRNSRLMNAEVHYNKVFPTSLKL